MRAIFYPESLVVLGVSAKPENMGKNIIANLQQFGYRGKIYAIGRERGEVFGVQIYSAVEELPQGIDLAVFLTPAPLVPELLDRCGRKGIKWAVIESAGFSEFSEEGRALEDRLLEVARRWEIRFVGPNCLSIINLENGLALPFVLLSPTAARPGKISVVSQSGGVALTYANLLSVSGLGVNKIVSIGNKLDLDEIDYLEYLLADPGTELIILYLEGIEDGRRLMELARTARKPILLHKAHRGTASSAIARSHTAALANDDRVVSAAALQSGLIRVPDFRAAVNCAKALFLPPVRGNRLAVIARTGGHAVIAADGAEATGFELYRFPQAFLSKVQGLFRAKVIKPTNPLDLGDLFDLRLYAWITEECLRMAEVDAVLLVHTYAANTEARETRELVTRVKALSHRYGKPVALTVLTEREELARLEQELDWPFFLGIEDALGALAAARDYYLRRRSLEGVRVPTGANPRTDGRISELLRNRAGGALPLDESLTLLELLGIPTAPWVKVRTAREALQAAEHLGYPLAAKVISPELLHKTEFGGLALDITDGSQLAQACEALLAGVRQRLPQARIEGFLLQRMASGGEELILGGRRERAFGPAVLLGLGGIYAELLAKTAVRVTPLTRADAEQMIAESGLDRLIAGFRGRRPLDKESLVEAILKVSQLLIEQPRIAELDINPLLLREEGILALDARILLA
ncbi:MAG: acetate--CoA ligase family protein [Candidatus Acetothermia bacterium]|jgi:acetyltransferase|nr:acetate--CoA ligase family protein [Candidatus Acetothermia bacterium]MDH7505192.1 acetate--CoA ligase family protein [Candidatus Acetothermia bacterium]